MKPGHLRAALKLAGLTTKDRDWLLGQLDDDARSAVTAVLKRLEQSGFGPAPESQKETVTGHARNRIFSTFEVIRHASPQVVADVLLREPDWVIAVVLQEEQWSWLERVLSQFSAEQRMRLGDSLRPDRVSVTAAVREAVLESLGTELTNEQETRDRHSKFETLLSRIENRAHGNTD